MIRSIKALWFALKLMVPIAWAQAIRSRRRFGVVANYGRVERLGFYSLGAAKHWAYRAHLLNYELFEYDPAQRATPALHHQRNDRA